MSLSTPAFVQADFRRVTVRVAPLALPDVDLRSLLEVGSIVLSHCNGGSDDFAFVENLATWWSEDCWVREFVWDLAAQGEVAVVDWLSHLLVMAVHADEGRLAGILALDLRDVSRVVQHINCGTLPGVHQLTARSPVRVAQWLSRSGIRLAPTLDQGCHPAGSAQVTAAWFGGQRINEGDEFDALLQFALTKLQPVVVELDDGLRRHALIPMASVDWVSLDSDIYCIDLLRRRGGWMNRFGRWTWDPHRVDPLPPLQAMQSLA